MILTERDAATKFCQEAFGGHKPTDKCIGSKCMAWKWVGKASRELSTKFGEEPKYEKIPDSERHGCCGKVYR